MTPLAPDSCQRPFIWSVAFVSVRDSLSGSQAADEGPQDEPDDMRPGLLANIPGMSLSGVCPPPVGCGQPVQPDGKCKAKCSVGVVRVGLGEPTVLLLWLLMRAACDLCVVQSKRISSWQRCRERAPTPPKARLLGSGQ